MAQFGLTKDFIILYKKDWIDRYDRFKKFSRRDFLKGSAVAAGAALFGWMGASTSEAHAEFIPDTAKKGGKEDLYILYTNDVHCGVDDNIGYLGLVEAKNALIAAGKNVLLVDCGDYLQGGTYGVIEKGKYIIEIMNQVGYDICTIGNHEFDYGVDELLERTKELNCPVVCAYFSGPDGELFYPYRILEKAGRKIAFIGTVTPITLTNVSPQYFQNEEGKLIYDFCYDKTGDKLIACLQKTIDAAKEDGADFIVMLAHLGVDPDHTIDSMTGIFLSDRMIPKLSGVDLWLDGHSHTVLPCEYVKDKEGKEVPLTQTGTKLAYIGLATVAENGAVTTQLLDESGLKTLLKQIEEEMGEEYGKVVGTAEYDLVTDDPAHPGTRIIRTEETNLGDFCADAVRTGCNAEIGVINGGGCRTCIPKGDVTLEEFLNVFPFNNEMCVRSVKGSAILDMLELSVSQLPAEFGGFLQVSGISYTVDVSLPTPVQMDSNGMFASVEGERRIKDVYISGEPLEEDKEYSIASISFLLKNNGNGYTMFGDAPFIEETGPSDFQTLVQYFQETLGGKIGDEYENPYGDGRIVIEK